MGYRSDVRIITSKRGYEALKNYNNKYLKKLNAIDYSLLDISNIYGKSKNMICIGWDNIKWYEDCDYKGVDSIMNGIKYLKDNDYSYRFSRMGEYYDDVYEDLFDSKKREKIDLPYLYIERKFEDSYIADVMYKDNIKSRDVER